MMRGVSVVGRVPSCFMGRDENIHSEELSSCGRGQRPLGRSRMSTMSSRRQHWARQWRERSIAVKSTVSSVLCLGGGDATAQQVDDAWASRLIDGKNGRTAL